MKVAIAVFTTGFGGVPRYVLSLGSKLREAGISTFLLLRDPALMEKAGSYNLKAFQIPKRMKYDFIFLFKVCSIIRNAPDIVHSNGTLSTTCISICQTFFRIKTLHVAAVHSLPEIDFSYGKVKLRFHNELNRLGWRKAERIIVMAGFLKERLVAEGVPAKKIRVVHNGVELDAYRPYYHMRKTKDEVSRGKLRIGYAGRLSKEKGVDVLLQALAELRHFKNDLKIEVMVMGEGTERPQLSKLKRDLDLGDTVRFTGFERNIGKVLSSLDIFVLPSRMETFPMVLLEAGAVGVPIIATNVGGIPEMITDGKEGLLVPPESPRAMAEAIMRLMESPELRFTLGEAFHARIARDFTLDSMCQKTLAVYQEVSGNKREVTK